MHYIYGWARFTIMHSAEMRVKTWCAANDSSLLCLLVGMLILARVSCNLLTHLLVTWHYHKLRALACCGVFAETKYVTWSLLVGLMYARLLSEGEAENNCTDIMYAYTLHWPHNMSQVYAWFFIAYNPTGKGVSKLKSYAEEESMSHGIN